MILNIFITILTILLFLFILTLIVVVHEFGHFITAKKFGVTVDEFSIGMGPLVSKKMYHGTQYSLRAFPIGGYVKMVGEEKVENTPGSFSVLAPWKRLIVIYAGVIMNFVLAVVIFAILAIKSGGVFFGSTFDPNYQYPIGNTGHYKIGVQAVQDGSPAQAAGLKTGDVIDKVAGVDYSSPTEFFSILDQNNGKVVNFDVVPYLGGDQKNVNMLVRDKTTLKEGEGRVGIDVIQTPFTKLQYPFAWGIFTPVLQTANTTHNYVATLGFIIGKAVELNKPEIATDSLSSPVGIYAVTRKVLDLNGFWGILTITAILSLAIGILNAVPFPALDGWHGVFIIFEWIFRRKVNERLYNAVTLAGFVLLLALGALVMLKDILNFNKLFM